MTNLIKKFEGNKQRYFGGPGYKKNAKPASVKKRNKGYTPVVFDTP